MTANDAPDQVRSPWERYGWLMAVVWLFFLVYPIIGLVRSTAPLPWIIVAWTAMAVFAALYVIGIVRGLGGTVGGLTTPPHTVQWVTFGALIVCVLASVPAEGASVLSFLPFLMAFASYGLNRLAHWITSIGAIVLTAAVVVVHPDGTAYLSVLAIIVLLGVVYTVTTMLIIRSAESERLGRELATSEGRETVARDVHDLIGHSLTVVGLKAQLAHKLVDVDPARAKEELADIERLTAEAIAGVRATVSGARTATLTEQLASCRAALEAADVSVRLEGRPALLSPAQSLTASWILREATTNILRHAQATTVTVQIAPGKLAVADDGVGPGDTVGNGVRGMTERAAAAGAAFTLSARHPRGTRAEVVW